ncbi:sapecin-like [Zeugodacus cucurbitae]|uniref:sapecin-like n=1 Tax=Zeugodacus cucurbitae TaxID=28588 RepID=UPI0005968930|nr:sapecin-like [Zeugodacus cucurbitae]
MKTIVLFAGLLCAFFLFQAINAAPAGADVGELEEAELPGLEEQQLSESIRQKRATCDLLSGFGVKHSACAAHCLLRGKRGGYCNGRGVCECRN